MPATPSPLLGPIIALVAWSLVMLFWMGIARRRALQSLGSRLELKPGMRGSDLERVVEPRLQWPAHNYNHMLEQPTLFYAICFALILLGGGGVAVNLWLAWGYVALRVAHSVVQATINIVKLRFLLFGLASFCLLGLTVHAAARVLRASF